VFLVLRVIALLLSAFVSDVVRQLNEFNDDGDYWLPN